MSICLRGGVIPVQKGESNSQKQSIWDALLARLDRAGDITYDFFPLSRNNGIEAERCCHNKKDRFDSFVVAGNTHGIT